MAYTATSLMYLNAYLRARAHPINNRQQCVCIQYSLVPRCSGGGAKEKNAWCTLFTYAMITSSCGLGFAHDVDIRALRSRLATNSISTVCSGYGQSSTHSCSIDSCSCLKLLTVTADVPSFGWTHQSNFGEY